MAHPPDRALTDAIADVLRQARNRGMTTRELADWFNVADATISRWETGNRLPALDLLPSFDRLAGRERGYVLRLAGYVDDPEAFKVNRDDPEEVAIWNLEKLPKLYRQRMIEDLRQANGGPPPKRDGRRTRTRRSA